MTLWSTLKPKSNPHETHSSLNHTLPPSPCGYLLSVLICYPTLHFGLVNVRIFGFGLRGFTALRASASFVMQDLESALVPTPDGIGDVHYIPNFVTEQEEEYLIKKVSRSMHILFWYQPGPP